MALPSKNECNAKSPLAFFVQCNILPAVRAVELRKVKAVQSQANQGSDR